MKGIFQKVACGMLVFALTLSLCGCSLLPTEEDVIAPPLVEPEVVEYKTTPVGRDTIMEKLTVSGTLVSTEQHSVSFEERGGYVSAVYVGNGSNVEEGQVIAELDVDSLQKQIRMQRYTIEKLEINLESVINNTLENKMSDAQKRQVRLAEIDLEIARITLSELYEELEKSVIYAPISGKVVWMNDIRVGDYINAKSTVCTIADPSALFLRITGDDVKELSLNADVLVNMKQQTYNGTIVVTPQTAPDDAKDKNYVLIEVQDLPEEAAIGDLATAQVVLDERTDVLVVSRSLISSYGGGAYYVQVLDENGVRQERPIEVGLMTSTLVEVLEGLEEGELIIVR